MMSMQAIETMEQLGRAIRTRRKERGYTQATVAAYAGCSARFLSELERGKCTAEMGKALRVIEILGMDLFIEPRGARQ